MQMPKPNEHHARFAPLVGTWTGEERMLPSHWTPEGAVASAHIVNHPSASGFVMAQDYEQRRDGEVVFSGHGVLWIDQATHEVRMTWWDNMGMAPSEFRGGWEGDRLVLCSESPMGHTRGIWALTESGYTHTMEMSQDGQTWALFMEGSYTREA